MTDDLSLATRAVRHDGGRFTTDVPAGWEQGRGAFGGVVVGAMARAAIASEPDAERTLRAVSLEILAPVPAGPAELAVEVLRRGSGVTAIDVRLRPALRPGAGAAVGDVLARATFTLGKTRVTDRDLAVREPPEMPPFESLPRAPVGPPFGPVFTQHLDYRVTGPLPLSGGTDPRVEGWVHAPAASEWGPPEWLALVDAYWPTLLSIESAPRSAVTLTYTAHVVSTPPRGPLYYRARAVAARDGYLTELRELFASDGSLVVVNPQVLAIGK